MLCPQTLILTNLSRWEENLYVLNSSCSPTYGQNNSPQELRDIKSFLPKAADYAGVPASLFLAMMMQESDGCVRVGTTANGVTNPGIMQSNNGEGNCIKISPCPVNRIEQMLMEGAGKNREFGLKQAVDLFKNISEPAKFYRAARAYNAGPNGVVAENLEQGGATRCYASDIANRLLGWTHRADRVCPYDGATYVSSASMVASGNSTISSSRYASTTINCGNRQGTPVPLPNCKKYHMTVLNDTCDKVASTYQTSVEKLREFNPSLDANCTNLLLGYYYCISM